MAERNEILNFLAPGIRQVLAKSPSSLWPLLEELRLRAEKPLQVEAGKSTLVTPDGRFTDCIDRAYFVGTEEIIRTLQLMGGNSLYTLEEELKEGFLTLPGGHRVGLAGECMAKGGQLIRIKKVTGLNIRVARQVLGCAAPVIPYLTESDRPFRTLIISPPQAGKTTLLRDLIRLLSNGEGVNAPVKIGLVDERNEVSGCYQGVPQLDVGIRTDVLSGCPKKEGIFLLLRAMGPQVIATDEIGRPGDIEFIEEILNSGVGFITTAHARNIVDLSSRPGLRRIWRRGLIERVVILSRRLGSGTLEGIWNGVTKEPVLLKTERLGEVAAR